MAEEGEVDVRWRRMGLENAVDFLGLPVDDTGNNEGQTAPGMLVL